MALLARGRRPHFAALALLAVAGMLAAVVPTLASEYGVTPPAGCTCHRDDPSTTVVIDLQGWPLIYTPGEGYPLNVSASGDVAGVAGGFSAAVSKGSLSSTDPLVSASGRFATHTGPEERTWPLLWIAPPEDSGNVSFTVYVNLANGDATEGPEDHWNLATFTSAEKAPEPPKPSNMEITFEWEGAGPTAGRNLTVVAHLTNFTGAPIPNAAVAFTAHFSFGLLPLGENRTNAAGEARVNWSAVAQGDYLFLARYDGSARNLSVAVNASARVSDPDQVFESIYGRPTVRQSGLFDPVRVPLGLIVGGVWLTFAYAGLQVLRVRGQGRPAADGLRDLLKLLVPQMRRSRRKKP